MLARDKPRGCHHDLGKKIGDVEGQMLAINHLARLDGTAGDINRTREEFSAARELAHAAGHTDNEALAVGNLCMAQHRAWDLTAARAACEESIRLSSVSGDRRLALLYRVESTMLLVDLGRFAEAETQLGNLIETARRLEIAQVEGSVGVQLAETFSRHGRRKQSARALAEAQLVIQKLDDPQLHVQFDVERARACDQSRAGERSSATRPTARSCATRRRVLAPSLSLRPSRMIFGEQQVGMSPPGPDASPRRYRATGRAPYRPESSMRTIDSGGHSRHSRSESQADGRENRAAGADVVNAA
jgi:hypothetical protein